MAAGMILRAGMTGYGGNDDMRMIDWRDCGIVGVVELLELRDCWVCGCGVV